MTKLSHFEENLLTELRAVVAEQADAPRAARPRKRLALAAASVVAAGLVVGLPALNGARAPAAHAVTLNDDGALGIIVNRLEDPEGLERELAAYGITADVAFLPLGKKCRTVPGRFQWDEGWISSILPESQAGARPLVVVRPTDIGGRTLVVEVSAGQRVGQYDVVLYTVSGPVAPCVPVDMPAE